MYNYYTELKKQKELEEKKKQEEELKKTKLYRESNIPLVIFTI